MKKWIGAISGLLIFPWVVSMIWMATTGESRAASSGNTAAILETHEENQDMESEDAAVSSAQVMNQSQPRILVKRENLQTYMWLEEYLPGIIACQINPEYEMEALKCQAVIARTYLYRLLDGRSEIHEEELDLDYLEDGQQTRQWDLEKTREYLKRCEQAVTETAGIVMQYEERCILPMFHGVSTGRTRQGTEDYPYLQSVESKWDSAYEEFNQTFSWEPDEFAKRISRIADAAPVSGDQLPQEIQTVKKDDAGYILELKVGARTYQGEEIQYALELPSAAYQFSGQDGKIYAAVRGKGHGYGLSQAGADAMAKDGWGYQDILNYYYKNISIISE
ncbi:MAG: SpoIID/LytB domain-containing protein [Lachnospiraceae bacterium]